MSIEEERRNLVSSEPLKACDQGLVAQSAEQLVDVAVKKSGLVRVGSSQ